MSESEECEAITIPAHAPLGFAERNAQAEEAISHAAKLVLLQEQQTAIARQIETETRAYHEAMGAVLTSDLEGA